MRGSNLLHSILSALLFLLFCASANASSPEDAISTAVRALKAKGDLSPLVAHIDWEWRFSQLGDDEKKSRGISSASSLRNHYLSRAEANGSDVLESLKEDARNAAPGKKSAALELITRVESELLRQQQQFKSALRETSYKVGSLKMEGDSVAIANIEKSKGVAIQSEELRLRLVNGEWLFESAAPLNPLPITFGGTPLGKLPEPIAILGQP